MFVVSNTVPHLTHYRRCWILPVSGSSLVKHIFFLGFGQGQHTWWVGKRPFAGYTILVGQSSLNCLKKPLRSSRVWPCLRGFQWVEVVRESSETQQNPSWYWFLSDLSDAMTVNHPISDVAPSDSESLSQDLSMVNQIRTMIFEIMASERSLTQQRVQDKVLEMMSLLWEMLDNSTAVTSMATSMSSLLVSWLPSSLAISTGRRTWLTFSGNVTSWVWQVLDTHCKESTDSAEQIFTSIICTGDRLH